MQLGKDFLQVQDNDYSILEAAKKWLKVFPFARSLYLKAKHQLLDETKSHCESHLQTVGKFSDSAKFEGTSGSWNRLLSGQVNYPFF